MKKLTVLLILISIFGCGPTVTHMREPEVATFNIVSKSLVIGQTTKNDISKKYGIPTTKTYFSSGIERWKYFYNLSVVSDLSRHLGTYGVMDKEICFDFNPAGVLIVYSYEATPQ